MLSLLVTMVCLTLVTEAITEIVVKSQIFLPFRKYVSSKSQFLKELFHCGYCFSVWVATGVTLICGISIPLTERGIIDVPVTVLVVHRLSNIVHNVIDKWTDKYYDTRFVNTDKSEE